MSLGGRPKRTPLAFAATRPLLVRCWINSRSNSAMPANTVSTMRPAGEVVSAQGSASERRPAPDLLQLLGDVEQAASGARQSVEPRHHHGVVVAQLLDHLGQLGSVALRARHLLLECPLASDILQRGALQPEILVIGGHTGVANQHVAKLYQNSNIMQLTFATPAHEENRAPEPLSRNLGHARHPCRGADPTLARWNTLSCEVANRDYVTI